MRRLVSYQGGSLTGGGGGCHQFFFCGLWTGCESKAISGHLMTDGRWRLARNPPVHKVLGAKGEGGSGSLWGETTARVPKSPRIVHARHATTAPQTPSNPPSGTMGCYPNCLFWHVQGPSQGVRRGREDGWSVFRGGGGGIAQIPWAGQTRDLALVNQTGH